MWAIRRCLSSLRRASRSTAANVDRMGRQRFNDLDLADRWSIVDQGQSWLAGHLERLSDADFDGDSLLPGWQRRHVVAHIAYNARGLSRLADWAATGVETPMYPSAEARASEIGAGAVAAPAELRAFVVASAAELAGKWRAMSKDAWQATVRTVSGLEIPAGTAIWMRAKEVWIHTVDLGVGGRYAEFPEEVLNQLLADIPDSGITGSPAGVARWATGRGSGELAADPGIDPPAWM
jgi:maleylpyruvate isomerase